MTTYNQNNSTHRKQLTDGLSGLKPGDFILWNNDKIENNVIKYGSLSPYGHASIYIGNYEGKAHQIIDLPRRRTSVASAAVADSTEGLALVHCSNLDDAKRERILQCASYYWQKNKDAVRTDNFDTFGGALQGALSIVGGIPADLAFSPGVAQGARSVVESPATLFNILNNAIDDFPVLTCASFVTYIHDAAGHVIDPGLLKMSHTSSPRALWDAANGNPSRFKVTEVKFA